MPLNTKAGAWSATAQTVYREICFAKMMAGIRWYLARQEEPDDIPDDLHRSMSAATTNQLGTLGRRLDARADELEKFAHALVRMRLMAREDPVYMLLPSLSWDSAITIARWALNDPDGARGEMQRHLDGVADTGPRPTKRRYAEAIAGIPRAHRRTMDSFKQTSAMPDEWLVASRYRLARGQLKRNNWSTLSSLLRDFVAMGAGDLVDHAIAVELPSLAFSNDHHALGAIEEAFLRTGARSAAVCSGAALMTIRKMMREPKTGKLVASLATLAPEEEAMACYLRALLNSRDLS